MKWAVLVVLVALNLQGCLSAGVKTPVNVASMSHVHNASDSYASPKPGECNNH